MSYDPKFEIYSGKPIGSLFQDIVTNSENKRNQLDMLVGDIREMIKTPENALMMVPLIRDYLDVGIKNDEQLVKLAAVVQRLLNSANESSDGSGGFSLSEEEKKQLMTEIDNTVKSMTVIENKKLPELK